MNGNGQSDRHAPPQLGDVRLQNTRNGWQLWKGGRLVCEGLSLKQVLQIIRGEVGVAQLATGQGLSAGQDDAASGEGGHGHHRH